MSNAFEKLEREDVISVYSGGILVNNRTFTASEFIAAMLTVIKTQNGWTEEKANWFSEGIDCKLLKPGAKSWQRGKVRISLEFEPEKLEVEAIAVKKYIWKRDRDRCQSCGKTENETNLTIDHIIPLASGGSNDISNLQTLCHSCNSRKKHYFDPRFQRKFDF